MSADFVGLRTAVSWAAASAQKAKEAATEVEMAITNLTGGGTTGSAITDLQAVQEYHLLSAAKYMTAHDELVRQLQVAEAYEANKGAGTRQFVTAD